MISMTFNVKTFMEMTMRPWKLTLDIDATQYDGENSGTKVALCDAMASKAWCQTITSYNINVTDMGINRTMTCFQTL